MSDNEHVGRGVGFSRTSTHRAWRPAFHRAWRPTFHRAWRPALAGPTRRRMTVSRAMKPFLVLALCTAASVAAQQPAPPPAPANPSAGCSATPAQLEANKKVAMQFFQTAGDARVALADPIYKQHNPALVQGAREAGLSDCEYFQ